MPTQTAPVMTQHSTQNKYMFVMPPMLTLESRGYVRPHNTNIRTANPRLVTKPPPRLDVDPPNVRISSSYSSAARQPLCTNMYLANTKTSTGTSVRVSSPAVRLVKPNAYLTPSRPIRTNVPTSNIRLTAPQPTTNLGGIRYRPSTNKYVNQIPSDNVIQPRIIRTGQPFTINSESVQLNSKTNPAPSQNFISFPVNTSTGQTLIRFPLIKLVSSNQEQNSGPSSTPNVPVDKQSTYKNPFKYPSLETTNDIQKESPDAQSEQPQSIQSQTSNLLRNKPKSKEISEVDVWKCLICSEIKDSKDALIDHYEFHKEEKDKLEKAKNVSADSESRVREDLYQCPVCPKEFHVLHNYERHVNMEHGEKQFYCASCKLIYTNAYTLSVHNMDQHATVPDQYTCCVCKTFTTKSAQKLRRHIYDTHDNDTYRCEVCQKTFMSLTWLRDHKIFHIDTSAIECKICSMKFTRSWQLIAHNKRVHPNENNGGVARLYCEKCDLTFATKKALLKHLRSHSQEASLCFVCGKIFGNGKKLRKHMESHNRVKRFICNVCGSRFRKSDTLTTHLRIHSGERPHKCATCGKCFTQRSPLIVHQRQHTGEKPYICPFCNKGLISKSALSIHRRSCKGI